MIKKASRVPRQFIPVILSKGGETRSQFFIVRLRKNQQQFFRFRVIVSKKIEKSAINRNRLRRQIYEILRTNDQKHHENYDLILIPKKNIPKESFQILQTDIKNLFKQYG